MALTASSYIPTVASALTRTRDQLVFPFPARPQSMTIYIAFVEQGTVLQSVVGTLRILQIGNITGTSPLLGIEASPSVYRIRFNNGISAAQTSTLGAAPSIGQRVELRGVFTVSGATATCFLGQSINGAAETTSGATTPLVVPAAWSDTKLSINSVGTVAGTTGFNAYRAIWIVAGVQSLQSMRAWAGTA